MKSAFLTLIALVAMVPETASAAIKLENVLITSYSLGAGRSAAAVPYDIEIRQEGERLLAELSKEHKVVARNLPVEVAKCREGRVKPTGEFVRPRRRAKSLRLQLEAEYGRSPSGKSQVCEIVIDDLPLALDQPDPQASPPNPGRPGQPPG